VIFLVVTSEYFTHQGEILVQVGSCVMLLITLRKHTVQLTGNNIQICSCTPTDAGSMYCIYSGIQRLMTWIVHELLTFYLYSDGSMAGVFPSIWVEAHTSIFSSMCWVGCIHDFKLWGDITFYEHKSRSATLGKLFDFLCESYSFHDTQVCQVCFQCMLWS